MHNSLPTAAANPELLLLPGGLSRKQTFVGDSPQLRTDVAAPPSIPQLSKWNSSGSEALQKLKGAMSANEIERGEARRGDIYSTLPYVLRASVAPQYESPQCNENGCARHVPMRDGYGFHWVAL